MFRFFSGRFDVLVLSWLAPLATVGNYAIAQTVAELVLIIPQSFGFVVMPMVAAGEDHRAAPALRLAGTLALLGVLAVALAGPVMIVVGFGEAFRGALVPFFILLPGIWMLGLRQHLLVRSRGQEAPALVLAARRRRGRADRRYSTSR